ncbi:MAG: hypothetical protein ACMUIG_02990 [Thermoplasmatota archaeon]
MGMKVDRYRLSGLLHLVSDTGFSDETGIFDMALSLGLFFDRKGEKGDVPHKNVEASDLSIWPQVQIIVHNRDGGITDVSGMNIYLEPYLLGGLDMIIGKIGKKRGNSALRAIGELFPP